jgi:hypothetical protein
MWDDFKAWYASPFQADMSAWAWFYFIGLLIVISALWFLVLRHIREAVKG